MTIGTNPYGICPRDRWETTSLGDLAANDDGFVQTGPFGSQLHARDYKPTGTPVVMPKQLGDNQISTDDIARIADEDRDRLAKHIMQEGDIVFSRRGDVTRRAYIGTSEAGWLCGTGCMLIRVRNTRVNNRFLALFFSIPAFKKYISNKAVGATMPNLNTSILEGVPVVLPPLRTQERIVEVLSSYHSLIENNRRRIALLEEAAQQLYTEWFVRLRFPGHEHTKLVDSPLGKIPESWQVVKTQEIQANKKYALNGGPFGSKLGTKDYVEHGVPVIRGANIGGSSRFTMDDFVFVSEHKADTLSSNLAHPGDLIFTQRGTLGQVGMIPRKCPYKRFIVSQSQMKLTVNEDLVDREYVYQFFSSPIVIQRILNHSITSGVPHINLTTLREFKLLLPPRELQAEFADVVSDYDDFIETTTEQNKLLAEARDLLLPRLMSGEVEV